MIGWLIYLPTTAFVPQEFFVLAFVYGLFRRRDYFTKTLLKFGDKKIWVSAAFLFVVVIILLSLLNYFFNSPDPLITPRYFPQFVLLPVTIGVSLVFNKSDAKILSGLVAIECLVALLEYFAGVSTFFTSLSTYEEFIDSDLQYFNRPMGLSLNSSALAVKCMLVVLLIDFYQLYKSKWFKFILLWVLLGIYLTFPRTIFIALLVFVCFKFISWFMAKKPTVDWVYAFVLIAFGFTVLGFLVVEFSETIINQFTRNTQKVDLSGREKIWAQYIDQILSNPWFGNASHKVWFKYHAHNSFLQLIATNGIIISIFYFGFIVTHARRNNLIYLAVMMVYSFFQYGIFWGISIIDIVFYVFLLKAAEREGTRFFSISP